MSPDRRRHRGAHPDDPRLFAPGSIERLRQASADLSWLLSRGYAPTSSLNIVGDRYDLAARQRAAVARCAESAERLDARRRTRVALAALGGRDVAVDGFNLLITVETGLSLGPVLLGRDRVLRDLAGVHGSYRTVEETAPALAFLFEALQRPGPRSVLWLLDRPVSNSGRLAAKLRDEARARGLPWDAKAVFHPDRALVRSGRVVLSSDSAVLDRAPAWTALPPALLREREPRAWIVDLGPEPGP